jgi:homoserine O-acetyltransferase
MALSRLALFPSLVLLLAGCATAQEQQFASLGDFKLASGEVLRDCRIGYRTFGKLNAAKSNVVLFPMWAGGNTGQISSTAGPGNGLDLSKDFVVAVDPLSNGVSSSPSNSRLQPRMHFPKYTMRDVVETQHALLTRVLHIDHLKAVMGISMGGMQTFQWIVSYPEFMDRAIPIVGSPRLAPYDLLHWQTQIDAIENDAAWRKGDYAENPARVAEAEFGALLLTSPEHFNAHTTRQQVSEMLDKAKRDKSGSDANNKIRQVQAMMSIDVSEKFGGSLASAAAAVKAKVLVISSVQDHVVTPGPAFEFGRLLHAGIVRLEGDCGHLAPNCEGPKVAAAVHAFLYQ